MSAFNILYALWLEASFNNSVVQGYFIGPYLDSYYDIMIREPIIVLFAFSILPKRQLRERTSHARIDFGDFAPD